MPTSHEGNRQVIPKRDSARARRLLCEFDRSTQVLDKIPTAAEIKNALTKSELCFLKRDYPGAKKYGFQALDIAKASGFELETEPAQENMNHICHYSGYCATQTTSEKLQDKTTSSNSYTCSSSTDSDQRAS